ncbi:MAG: FtsX-like permease family protein [Phycisphaerae bacterium]
MASRLAMLLTCFTVLCLMGQGSGPHNAAMAAPSGATTTQAGATTAPATETDQPTEASRHEKRVKKISPSEIRYFERLATFNADALKNIDQRTDKQALRERMDEILAAGKLFVGARKYTRAEGERYARAPIHRYLQKEIDELESHGLVDLGSLQGVVGVPVMTDALNDDQLREDKPAHLRIGQQEFEVLPMWPNGAMPSLAPKGGLQGRLIYVGAAEWKDLEGLDLKGAIALADFEASRNWNRLVNMGAQAVVVRRDGNINRENAEGWFSNTPVPFPRYYVDEKIGSELLARATRKEYLEDGSVRTIDGKEASLHGGHVYEMRRFESPMAYLPPTDPVVYKVQRQDLLIRIAVQFGVSPGQLRQLNADVLGDKEAGELVGKTLKIPESTRTYEIRQNDLLDRLAVEYGVDAEAIRKVNGLEAGQRLTAGMEVTIPNVDKPVTLLVPIDAVSVVPDARLGGKAAFNMAIALEAMEHLATSKDIVRRKGILFGFLDAEAMGGMSSRTFAESLLLLNDELATTRYEDPEEKLRRYRLGVKWFKDPESVEMGEDDLLWFGEQWLRGRVEERRVHFAEQRAAAKRRRLENSNQIIRLREDLQELEEGDRQLRQEIQQRIEELQRGMEVFTARIKTESEKLDRVVEVKRNSLDKTTGWAERIDLLRRELIRLKEQGHAEELGFSLERMERRLRAEREELAFYQKLSENNKNVVQTVMMKLHDTLEPSEPLLGWILNLSDGSHSLNLRESFRAGIIKLDPKRGYLDRFKEVLSYASVQAGWTEDWLVLTDKDAGEVPVANTGKVGTYVDFWLAPRIAVLSVGTHNDNELLLDTPRDVPSEMNFDNLSTQARNMLVLLRMGLENPIDTLAPDKLTKARYSRLIGTVAKYNVRSGLNAEDPIADVSVYFPGLQKQEGANSRNTAKFLGTRKSLLRKSLLNGSYAMPLESLTFQGKPMVYAYRLDRDTALFDMVVDQGQIGTGKQKPNVSFAGGEDVDKKLIMTEVYPFVFCPGVDPMDYKALGSEEQTVAVRDVAFNGEPRHYALDNPPLKYSETDMDANILYAEPGRRTQVIAKRNIAYKMLLIGAVNEEYPRGYGYQIGPKYNEETGEVIDRNLILPFAEYEIARQMRELAEERRKLYEDRGISDRSVAVSVKRADDKLDLAREAFDKRDWRAGVGASREAWGILVKSYPRIMELGREAVFSAVVLMALLVPAAVFLEKLIIGGRGIVARLIGITIIFVLGTVFLNYFHPAFQISVSPFIVMIAFTMILMSVVVLTLMYQRFDVLVRRARAAGGEVESEEISLMSSLSTALALGVSNLKKRPARTALTVFTVTVLTFSIITFVSVKGSDTLLERDVQLDTHVGSESIDPMPPAYSGVLFRNYQWKGLEVNFVSAIQSEFGPHFEMTVRGYYVQQEGGNNQDREGANQEEIRYGENTTIATALMSFEPNETHFSKLHRAVSNKQWFRGENRSIGRAADKDMLIIPFELANRLKIKSHMLYQGPDVYTVEETAPVEQVAREIGRLRNLAVSADDLKLLNNLTGDTVEAGTELQVPIRWSFQADMTLAEVAMYLGIPVDEVRDIEGLGGDAFTKPELLEGEEVKLENYHLARDVELLLPRRKLLEKDQLPRVQLKSRWWRVMGILDSEKADRIRDISGKSLAMVDYLRSAFTPNIAVGDLVNESASYHISWDTLVIIPRTSGADVKSKPRTVAVKFPDDMSEEQVARFQKDVALRLNRSMFANFPNTPDDQLAIVTTQEDSSVGGLAKIVVPVILCVLIVLNTMMANVEERKGEVGMLGAIGLSPSQISFLLLSESAVFSVLGIVFGTFSGLLFANTVDYIQVNHNPEFLSTLSVNFTSLSSLALAMGTGLVVLLATIIPARKAAALAAPSGMANWELPEPSPDRRIGFDLPFTLTRGNAVGMMAFFRQFLVNHTDAASQDFNCRNIRHALISNGEDALMIRTDMWLAPYDLDVAQDLEMKVTPTENEGVFGVNIVLHRTSGTEEAWLRTNYGFMDLVRHQFLIWRNLDDAARKRYINEGAELFQGASS